MACFMLIHGVKHWRAAVRPPYCTGMRILKLTVLTMGSVLLAQDQMPTIKVDVDVVNILASVRDKRGARTPSRQKEYFTILEDGKAQPIKYFTKETDLPLTIGLLVDVSGSQTNLIDIERSAAAQFFRDVLRVGSDPEKDKPLGVWRDADGIRWRHLGNQRYERVD